MGKAIKDLLTWVVVLLITIGVVLGAWRFLGDGLAITDTGWVSNARDNITELMNRSGEIADESVDNLNNG